MLFTVNVVISYKPSIRDPEGETIYRQLILKNNYSMMKNVRAGKFLRLLVEAESPEKAVEQVKQACLDLRIYNPVVHEIEVFLHGR
ncbi:Phosphoribosylformylglycinamidine synthase [Desulfurococcus amylolyticus 1221n]|uniref:Phosphoribosylformylglycinamidine synthase subunit PurS n=2 Tax=Desulfurococcus amylolyticus TaxID=94694 RepID=B8D415_DESA1|nr:Phosphoribosylformylglycinamidine synthase [Desulfurococcus amylolyticus 1221n]